MSNKKCNHTIEFDSDFGGYHRAAVFYCKLPKGHTGKHKESANDTVLRSGKAYTITWEASKAPTHTTTATKKEGD